MSSFNEAFESITKTRHYEPPPTLAAVQLASTTTTIQSSTTGSASNANAVKSAKAILVNPKQKGNPILRYVRSVPLEFATDAGMIADYLISQTTAVLYISIKYHKLNPEYLITRIEALKRSHRLRLVLVQVDDVDCENALLRIQTLCVANSFTVICSFSEEESARYLETYKFNEKKSSEDIEEKKTVDHISRAIDAITKVRSVNKSDAKNLLRNFKSVGEIMQASMEDFALCAGIGEKKVARMYAAFNEPFFGATHAERTTTIVEPPDIIELDMEREEQYEYPVDD